jgi:hypothetical protein
MPRKTKGIRPVGPPTKKTPEIVQKMIEVARTGVPLRFVAAAGGVAYQTLSDWRDNDLAFGLAIEQARSESVRERWEAIKRLGLGTKNSQPNWAALAWQLERSFPCEFGKPEAQLNLQVHSQTNNTLVITASQAEEFEQRSRKVNSEIDSLLEERQKRFATREPIDNQSERSSAPVRDIQTEVISDQSITLPPESERGAGWWKQLTRGDSSRSITAQAALFVVSTVMIKIFGLVKASKMEIEFDDKEQPRLCDVHAAIAELCGPPGWEILVSLGET